MTYLQVHKRPYERLKRSILLIVSLIVIVVVTMQLTRPHIFPELFTAIVQPFWRMEFSIESGALNQPKTLLNEKEALIRQLKEAQVRLDTIRVIELENNELKALLGRQSSVSNTSLNIPTSTPFVNPKDSPKNAQKINETGILAAVLKRPPFSSYDELIIDIGHNYNLSTSSLIYAIGDILIGRVVDVLSTTAKVKLFSSSGEKFEVMIGSTHAPATAIGRGGGQYEAQVSRDTIVKEGDFVLNSSLNNKPFGIVSAVLQDPTEAFETVLFAPLVNIYQLRWVLVKN